MTSSGRSIDVGKVWQSMVGPWWDHGGHGLWTMGETAGNVLVLADLQ